MRDLPARYEHRRLLGQGGMGQVHLVWDKEREQEVALKTFRAEGEEGRFLFKQEFWAMASLRHPNLVAAYDYGELADGTPYFTMEVVGGQDLTPPQDEAAVRAWLPGIAAALGYLHGQGYVHGDLKPENIRLGDVPKLMDLGLLTRAGRAGGPIRGSLHYLAPEVARQAALDGRADLYALGAVVYHALAGRPPFEGESAVSLLRAHLDAPPPPLRQHAPAVSRELEAAIMKLLAKEPAQRFASASELMEALGLHVEGVEAHNLLGSPLFGREDVQGEIATLLASEAGGTRWIVGGAGSGKSRLLQESRATAQLEGLPTFYAQGLGKETAPYAALRPWLKAIAAQPNPTRERLAPVLVRLVPELAVAPVPPLDGAQERMRLHNAIAELARAVAPSAVWLLDDADELDAASRELLGFLQAQGAGASWRWLLAAQSTGEGTRALPLAPLDEATTLRMARALLGQEALPDGLAERLPVLTGGLPGAVEAVLGHWVRAGALRRERGAWVAGDETLFELPGGWQVALDARFEALPVDAKRVGRVAALLGAQADLPWLAALVGLEQQAFFAALAQLEAAEVLAREDSQFRFVRPAQVAALVAAFPEAERKHLHTAAASWLVERLGEPADSPALPLADVIAVARHHLAGDSPAAAVPYLVAAGRRSLAMYVTAGLDALLRRALAVEGLPAAERLALQQVVGTVMRFEGRIDESLALYEEELLPALRAAHAPDLANELVTLGVILQMKGKYPRALEALAEAINLADAADDVEAGIRARVFAGRVGYFAGETGAARTHLASAVRRAREAGAMTHLAGALGLYGYVLASTDPGRLVEGLAALDEAVALNRESGNLYELHEALNNQGNVYMAAGRLADARGTFEECLALCQKMGMANEAIFAHLNLGAAQLEMGDLATALAQARKAGDMARQQGRKFPEGFATAIEGCALIFLGELSTGMERLERGLGLAREIKNRYLELNILVHRAEMLLHLGRFFETETSLAKAQELVEATHNDEQNGKLERLRAALAVCADAPDADARLSALVERTRAVGQAVPLAHALRWQADRLVRNGETSIADKLLAEATELAAETGLTALAAELHELWGRALAPTDRPAALARFERGLELAQASGYRLLEVLCQAGMGATDAGRRLDRQEAPKRLEALMGGLEPPERQDFINFPERVAALHAAAGEGASYSADRLHHLTDLIATVSAQTDLAAVMEQALAALVDIAGAERGFLLLYKGFEVTQQIFHGMREDESDAYSSSLAYQILWGGEPVFVEDAQSHQAFAGRESIQSLALRSMVGVPLYDGTETIGVMLADSQRINTRFTDEDLNLCMALGRQVAITIGNARRLERYRNGYEELGVLHRLALATLGMTAIEDFMKPVAEEAVRLCDADRVILLAGEELRCLAALDRAGERLPGAPADISSGVSQWVLEHGEPLHLLDAQSEEAFQSRKSIQMLGLRTIFAVPVTHAGQRLGVLYLDHTRMGDPNPQGLHALARIGEMVGAFLARRG